MSIVMASFHFLHSRSPPASVQSLRCKIDEVWGRRHGSRGLGLGSEAVWGLYCSGLKKIFFE